MESKSVTLLKDKDWCVIEGEWCKVLEFTPLVAKLDEGKVKASSKASPYASVVLECEKIQGNVTGYITHKVDFAMLCAAFNERTHVKGARTYMRTNEEGVLAFEAKQGLSDNEEVWIMWTRERYRLRSLLMFMPLPRLIVSVHPKGAYELVLNPKSRPELKGEAWAMAIAALVTWTPSVMGEQ